MIVKYKKWLLVAAVLILLGSVFYMQTRQGAATEFSEPELSEGTKHVQTASKKTEPAAGIVVDIKGAVRQPGVYELPAGARLKEAVDRAGGLLGEADSSKVNLAQLLQDGAMVYIPRTGEQTAAPAQAAQQKKVAINTATKEELEEIPGIGPKKAEAILQYRQENGLFETVEDLLEVSGIGEKSLEGMKDYIAVP